MIAAPADKCGNAVLQSQNIAVSRMRLLLRILLVGPGSRLRGSVLTVCPPSAGMKDRLDASPGTRSKGDPCPDVRGARACLFALSNNIGRRL